MGSPLYDIIFEPFEKKLTGYISFMGYRARAARGSKNPVVEQPPPVEALVGPP